MIRFCYNLRRGSSTLELCSSPSKSLERSEGWKDFNENVFDVDDILIIASYRGISRCQNRGRDKVMGERNKRIEATRRA